MFAYFGEMPVIRESTTCCSKFADKYESVTGQKYLKANKGVYNKLVQYGDAEKAVEIAESVCRSALKMVRVSHQRCGQHVWYIS